MDILTTINNINKKLIYLDLFSLYRASSSTQPNGSTKVSYSVNPVLSNIPCKLSNIDLQQVDGNIKDVNSIMLNRKIFCDVDLDVREGDLMSVTHQGKIYKYICGKPSLFITHQEISITYKGVA